MDEQGDNKMDEQGDNKMDEQGDEKIFEVGSKVTLKADLENPKGVYLITGKSDNGALLILEDIKNPGEKMEEIDPEDIYIASEEEIKAALSHSTTDEIAENAVIAAKKNESNAENNDSIGGKRRRKTMKKMKKMSKRKMAKWCKSKKNRRTKAGRKMCKKMKK